MTQMIKTGINKQIKSEVTSMGDTNGQNSYKKQKQINGEGKGMDDIIKQGRNRNKSVDCDAPVIVEKIRK